MVDKYSTGSGDVGIGNKPKKTKNKEKEASKRKGIENKTIPIEEKQLHPTEHVSKKRKRSNVDDGTPNTVVKKQKKEQPSSKKDINADKSKAKEISDKPKSKNKKGEDSLNKVSKKKKRPEKWIRKKKSKNKNAEDGEQEEHTSRRDKSLNYLKLWSTDRKAWAFSTRSQVWLVKNMYDGARVPDEYFTIMLSYLEGMRGKAREKTSEQAQAVMKNTDNKNESDSDSDSSSEDDADPAERIRRERARKVIQILT